MVAKGAGGRGIGAAEPVSPVPESEVEGLIHWPHFNLHHQEDFGDEEVQTTMYKISYKDIVYNMGNIANIL